MEKQVYEYWQKKDIRQKYLRKNAHSKKRFSFLDGPITANNPMGVHHAWGRTYKDMWQRFYNMRGYRQRFQNGFDCQGLWIEVEVERELGIKNKRDIENLVPSDKKASIAKFVQLCKDRVMKYSGIQTDQSKRLGYFMDWEHSYYTMSDANNYMIWYFLKTCYERGWIYKGKDSVPWCPRCQTAISQHEMLTEDYKELTHETLFVKMPIVSDGWENTSLLIWTTTPWTVPANVAIGVNISYSYKIWQNSRSGERIIFISKDENGNEPKRMLNNREVPVHEYIFKNIEDEYKQVEEISGTQLIGLQYEAPFDFLPRVKKAQTENPAGFHRVVDGSAIVMAAEGTGLLHVAPGAGKEDFDLGIKEQLPIIEVINDEADYLTGMDDFSGKNAKKHPEIIIDFLKNNQKGKFLLKSMRYTHRYPACWRCKTELVWKVAFEWYIAMDRAISVKGKEKTLREMMKDVAKKIHWLPGWGLDRELDWLSNMHDWLISKKNRYWGLALPIYECPKCGNFEVIGSKEELKKRAVAGWDQFENHSPHKPFIDDVKIKCSKCKVTISRIDDVGNVWLDAGIVPYSTYIDPTTGQLSYTHDRKYWEEWFPADFITESFPGQFKNWFYSMIAESTVLEYTNPYKTVLGYASVVGEDGRPMHKSWGNSVEFNEGADKIGVDVMRWMFVTHDPEQNVMFGYRTADETRRRFHLILWNVYNFFVTYANSDNWDHMKIVNKDFKPVNVLDRWILSRLNNLIGTVTSSLEKYDPQTGSVAIENFTLDLSQWYVRRSRDRVGPSATDKKDKSDTYITLYTVLTTLMKLLAPYIPYITEEIYRNLTESESIHLENWPIQNASLIDNELEQQMTVARNLVEAGHSIRKENKLKTRQPLAYAWHQESENKLVDPDVAGEILRELNIQKWIPKEKKDTFIKQNGVVSKEINGYSMYIDSNLTDELKDAGMARELIRQIQMKRKELGYSVNDKVKVVAPQWPMKYTDLIKNETMATELTKGDMLQVERI